MASMASLGRAVTGLTANQRGLQVTAHNLTNVNTDGYTRQRVNLVDASYSYYGENGRGSMSVGLGVNISEIAQIRDMFLDLSYRTETSREGYYSASADALQEIESIMGEFEGGDSFSNTLNELWDSLNELSKYPEGLETRGVFAQNASLFVEKTNYIYEQLTNYQYNLDSKVSEIADEINTLTARTAELNTIISTYESSGDYANDYRDERNNCLDRLAQLIDIKYREESNGSVAVLAEGHSVVTSGTYIPMELESGDTDSPFIKPIWSDTKKEVFNTNRTISPEYGNDKGLLKGILMARGDEIANYTYMDNLTKFEEIETSVIMKTQAQFDQLVHHVVTMINDTLAPYDSNTLARDELNAPYGLDETRHEELFIREYYDRYDDNDIYIAEDANDKYTLYSAGNLKINTELIGSVSKLPLSIEKDNPGDNQLIEQLLTSWQENSLRINPDQNYEQNIGDYYTELVSEIGTLGVQYNAHLENQTFMVNQVENQRQMISGVSSDEELANMMKYQHAYNANAKLVTVIDEMMERIINGLGLVGR